MLIMNGCVHETPFTIEKISPRAGLGLGDRWKIIMPTLKAEGSQ